MKDLTITAIIKVYQYDELNEADRSLMKTAMEATARSYAPYSHFSVGAAALLNDGTIVTGTNQENAAYPSGLCAERTTLFYANSQYPDQAVETLAIAARNERGEFLEEPIPPCGACRQVMLELGGAALPVILGNLAGAVASTDAAALLPGAFAPNDLPRA